MGSLLNLLFAPEHICTHDVVEQVEASLRRREQRLLSEPHPFPFLAAGRSTAALALSGGEELGVEGGDLDDAGLALLRTLGMIGVLELELPQVG